MGGKSTNGGGFALQNDIRYGMKLYTNYKPTDRMSDVISDEPSLLQMMSRFGISLGFGEQSVAQVCESNNVDTKTFLAVANFTKNGAKGAADQLGELSVRCLTDYLKQAHTYFLDFQLPAIRRKLLEAIDCSQSNEVSFLIVKFYDEYMGEVRKHMQYENRKVFSYVEDLLQGHRSGDYNIKQFARGHSNIDTKLQELKNIIIKYYTPTDKAEMLNNVLLNIFTCEIDLRMHCQVEEDIFVPAVEILESKVATGEAEKEAEGESQADLLSDREREIVHLVVCGLSNKEIAAKLFISLNTVLTHRKNIARKLNIHSVAGLTIYAIVNKIVDIDELKN